jgi:LytS/YehU family sensor histidine kinase
MRISKAHMRLVWVLVALTAALYCTAFFCPLAVYAASDNRFYWGPLGSAAYVVCILIFAQIARLAIRDFKKNRQVDFLLPVFGTLLIGICALLDVVLGIDFVSQMQITTMANPIACDCVFLGIHLQLTREYQRTRLEHQRTQLAISQIQPHFLYNTLTTIQSLCMSDPQSAARTTGEFAAYLRQNLNTLTQSGLIPFSKELEHVRKYAEIEMTRFPHIEVTYQIDDIDFMLPALSVQPLVENAIRHGVRVRDHGIVCVCSHREHGSHVVEVRDNGKGFDVSALKEQDTDEHIGIYNVRQRVRDMCAGEMKIASAVGEGTRVTLLIPHKEVPGEHPMH